MCLSVCALFYVGLSCQDVSSFGNNLSRCVVFRQGALCVSVCALFYVGLSCQDVSSLGRGALCVCVSVCALFYVSLSCQDLSSFGNNLSRCVVFRQGGSVCVCLYSVLCEP